MRIKELKAAVESSDLETEAKAELTEILENCFGEDEEAEEEIRGEAEDMAPRRDDQEEDYS